MARFVSAVSIVMLAYLLAGCSQSGEGGNASVSTDSNGSPASGELSSSHNSADGNPALAVAGPDVKLLPAPTASPQEVVQAFLDASRGGREELATELLSAKARQATSSQGLALDPPGPSSMVYRLGEVEYPTQDKQAAYVTSIWQEEGGAAGKESFEVTWILRHQREGWRIAGMASRASSESEPVLINFEDVADLNKIKPTVGGEPQVE